MVCGCGCEGAHSSHQHFGPRASPRANPGLPSHSSQVWWVTRGPRRRRGSAAASGSAEARRCECGGVGFLVCHLEVNNDKMSIVRVPGGGAGLRARGVGVVPGRRGGATSSSD